MYSDEQIAAVIHDACCRLQAIQGDPMPSPPWECTDETTRAIAVAGVADARDGMTPRELHEAWMARRKADGWVYGPDKDPILKTHPCMVDYDDLTPGKRDMDRVFRSLVDALTQGRYR